MQAEWAKGQKSSDGTCQEDMECEEARDLSLTAPKTSPPHSPALDIIMPAGDKASPEAFREQIQKRYQRYLILVSVVSLIVGGMIGFFAQASVPNGPGTRLTPPPGWTAICAPANVGALPTPKAGQLRVYVSGAVLIPQVVTVPRGSLVNDALVAAGGVATGADLTAINLAAPLMDHQQVVVPYKPQPSPAKEASPLIERGAEAETININRADSEVLQQLPRIGPALAERIIAYREEYGPFNSPEDLQKVSGIGLSTFEEIAPYIVVEP